MQSQPLSSEYLVWQLFCIVGIFILLILVILYIRSKWETPTTRTIHHIIHDESIDKPVEDTGCIYKCLNCGSVQHGIAPCEMCGYDDMKIIY